MRVAIPTWEGRVSPVFDVAEKILLEEISNEPLKLGQELTVPEKNPLERARFLKAFGAEIVICCALSRPHQIALASEGIRVISHICGRVEEVIEAIYNGKFPDSCLMPGCKRFHLSEHSKVFSCKCTQQEMGKATRGRRGKI